MTAASTAAGWDVSGDHAAETTKPCETHQLAPLVAVDLPTPNVGEPNKAIVYDLLMKCPADVMLTIAADPGHLGAKIAITSVLHTWGVMPKACFATTR